MAQVLPFQCSASGRVPPEALTYPTAVHLWAVAHETPFSARLAEPAELGVACTDQVLPFQYSATVSAVRLLSVYWPTAVQLVGEGQETPCKRLLAAAAGLGVAWIDHLLLPSQCSASITEAAGPLVSYHPTAVQLLARAHEIPTRVLNFVALVGLGVACTHHLLPFQCSASVNPAPLLSRYCPTAVQLVGAAHETSYRELAAAPAGLGVSWIDQVLPFQRSARVNAAPLLVWYSPTAVQLVGEVHDTCCSALLVAATGLGVCWMAHVLPFQYSASVTPIPAELM
jgi:hypothetical protein